MAELVEKEVQIKIESNDDVILLYPVTKIENILSIKDNEIDNIKTEIEVLKEKFGI